ncbi:uncharacterized protein LOC144951223 [Lampetra fluviatilis]
MAQNVSAGVPHVMPRGSTLRDAKRARFVTSAGHGKGTPLGLPDPAEFPAGSPLEPLDPGRGSPQGEREEAAGSSARRAQRETRGRGEEAMARMAEAAAAAAAPGLDSGEPVAGVGGADSRGEDYTCTTCTTCPTRTTHSTCTNVTWSPAVSRHHICAPGIRIENGGGRSDRRRRPRQSPVIQPG